MWKWGKESCYVTILRMWNSRQIRRSTIKSKWQRLDSCKQPFAMERLSHFDRKLHHWSSQVEASNSNHFLWWNKFFKHWVRTLSQCTPLFIFHNLLSHCKFNIIHYFRVMASNVKMNNSLISQWRKWQQSVKV